jgi:hypothetical protein
MKLADLDAKLGPTQLSFRCPQCMQHRIVVPIAAAEAAGKWHCTGVSVHDCTVTPSIKTTTSLPYLEIPKPGEAQRCVWHGFVTRGRVSTLGDSKISAITESN